MSQRKIKDEGDLRKQAGPRAGSSMPGAMPAVLIGLAFYLFLYFAAPLPSLSNLMGPGQDLLRWQLVLQVLLAIDTVAGGWIGDPPEFSVGDRVPIVLYASILFAFGTCAGWLLVKGLKIDRQLARLECFVFSAALGLGGCSLYALSIGWMGWLSRPYVLGIPAVGLAVAAAATARNRSGDDQTRRSEMPPTDNRTVGWIQLPWLWLTAPFVMAILLGAMLPPIEFDVREYHLQAPKEFYQAGQITFLPYNVYANMPLGTEMLSFLGMILADDWWTGALIGKTLIGLFAPLTALALFCAGRRFLETAAGVVAAVTYVSIPWVAKVSNLGLVEGAYALYLFLSVYALLIWNRTPTAADDRTVSKNAEAGTARLHGAWVITAGLLAGCAVACKYTAVAFVVAPLGLWLLVHRLPNWRRPDWRRLDWRATGFFLLAVCLVCGPWFLKNLLHTGNPVYPLLFAIFDGETRTPAKDEQWRRAHRPNGFDASVAWQHATDVLWRNEGLSPIIVPLAALALAVRRHRRITLWLFGYFAWVMVSWWLLTHRIDRFWVPAFPVLALLAGVGATWTSTRWWQITLTSLLAIGLTSNLVFVVSGPAGYNRFFVSYDSLRTTPERVDPWHVYLNNQVPVGATVLTVGDAQVFDLEMPLLYSTVFDDCVLETLFQDRTSEAFHDELVDRNVSHVYVHWGEIARYRKPGNYGFTPLVQHELFRNLVTHGVLARPEPMIEGHAGQVFRVLARE